jgi:hypothetical protein
VREKGNKEDTADREQQKDLWSNNKPHDTKISTHIVFWRKIYGNSLEMPIDLYHTTGRYCSTGPQRPRVHTHTVVIAVLSVEWISSVGAGVSERPSFI